MHITAEGAIIAWERVIDFDLVGYNVYRSELPTGVWTKLNTAPVKELKFIDSKGTKTQYYKIRAVDTSGNESMRSEAVNAR